MQCLMGETGEDLFLNVRCSWFSIHNATFQVKISERFDNLDSVVQKLINALGFHLTQ